MAEDLARRRDAAKLNLGRQWDLKTWISLQCPTPRTIPQHTRVTRYLQDNAAIMTWKHGVTMKEMLEAFGDYYAENVTEQKLGILFVDNTMDKELLGRNKGQVLQEDLTDVVAELEDVKRRWPFMKGRLYVRLVYELRERRVREVSPDFYNLCQKASLDVTIGDKATSMAVLEDFCCSVVAAFEQVVQVTAKKASANTASSTVLSNFLTTRRAWMNKYLSTLRSCHMKAIEGLESLCSQDEDYEYVGELGDVQVGEMPLTSSPEPSWLADDMEI